MADHSIVEADRHHLRMGRAFLVRHIERISDEGELIVPGVYPPHHLSVFVCQRVRDDAMRLAVDCSPKRQLVDVIVTVVEKPACCTCSRHVFTIGPYLQHQSIGRYPVDVSSDLMAFAI